MSERKLIKIFARSARWAKHIGIRTMDRIWYLIAGSSKMSDGATTGLSSERLCDVEDIVTRHPAITASDWRTPLVLRLLGEPSYCDGVRSVSVRYEHGSERFEGSLQVKWAGLSDDFDRRINTYQAPVLTEFATLGLACILVAEFPRMEITEVTRRGESADYWLGDRDCMLEVSGQQTGNLDDLLVKKRDQLLDNPFGMPGFVCAAIYSVKSACLCFFEGSHNES